MSKVEHAFEISARKAASKGAAEDAQRELVFDVIGQQALIFATGCDDVLVQPARKGALHHAVCKHPPRLVGNVLGDDGLPQRPHLDLQDDLRPDLE